MDPSNKRICPHTGMDVCRFAGRVEGVVPSASHPREHVRTRFARGELGETLNPAVRGSSMSPQADPRRGRLVRSLRKLTYEDDVTSPRRPAAGSRRASAKRNARVGPPFASVKFDRCSRGFLG